MKKILVTGAAGFVGMNLSLHLRKLGYEVVTLDIRDRLERIDYWNRNIVRKDEAEIVLHEADLTKGTSRLLADLDAIVHLAALPHVDYSYYYPEFVHYNNVQSTALLMKFAIQHDIPFILGSSVEVYGGEQPVPYRETDPYNPMSPYAASKVACEVLLKTYEKCYGLRAKVFRLTNLYGPWQAPDRIIPRNISRIVDESALDIQSNVVRDFLYVDDAVSAITLIMERGQYGHIYNISSGNGTFMAEIGQELNHVVGHEMERKEMREELTNARGATLVINSDKLRSELDWSPKVPLNEGLIRTYRWYSEHCSWVRRFRQQYLSDRSGKQFIVDCARPIRQDEQVSDSEAFINIG